MFTIKGRKAPYKEVNGVVMSKEEYNMYSDRENIIGVFLRAVTGDKAANAIIDSICVEFVVTPSKMTVNRLCKKTTIIYKDNDGRSLGFAEYKANMTRRMLNKYVFGVEYV